MIQGYFGLPGSGKTTFLTMLAQNELKKIRKNKSVYDKVLTNFYCDGCYKIDYKDLGHYSIENSLILLDISIHALRGEGDCKNIQICNAMLVHSAYKTIYFCDSCAFYLT